jgi:hypothetical protein
MYATIYAILLSLSGIQLPGHYCQITSDPDIGVQHTGIMTNCGYIKFQAEFATIQNDTLFYTIENNQITWRP